MAQAGKRGAINEKDVAVLAVVLCVLAYLMGSIPSAYIVGRYLYGVDIREHGSGNVGSTNALRVLGRWGAAIVFGADFLKGLLATWLAYHFVGETAAAFAALFVVCGHIFPIWLQFRGGKGVATGFGAIVALSPLMAGIAFLVWLVAVLLTGYVSLGSILAVVSVEVFILATGWTGLEVTLINILLLLIIFSHRENLKRLIAGNEHSFKKKKPKEKENEHAD